MKSKVPLATKLKIKYGLSSEPSDTKIRLWCSSTAKSVSEGRPKEVAGRKAALNSFGEIDSRVYLSEVDTISSLLKEAADMRELGLELRIKYKTDTIPDRKKISKWLRRVDELILDGASQERAGYQAAVEEFDVNPNLILKAESDTIEILLRRARDEEED